LVRWLRLLWIPVPAAIWFLLDYFLTGSGDFTFLILYSLLPLIGFLGFMIPKAERPLRWAALLLLIIYSSILVMEVLMMPYQAYKIWFTLLNHGSSRGRVSQLFIKLAGILSSFGAWYMIRKPKADLNLLFLPAFFVFLLFPSIYTALSVFVLFIIPLVRRGMGWRLFLVSTAALLIGLTGIQGEPRGIRLIDNSEDKLYETLIRRFPNLPLIYQVPLYGESLSEWVEDGSSPVLTNRNLLKINGPAGYWVYLRTTLYRDFTPSGHIAKVPSPVHRSDLPESTERPVGPIIHVTLLTDFMNLMPVTLKTSVIQTAQGSFQWNQPSQSLVWTDPPLVYEEDFILYEDRNKVELQDPEELKGYLSMPPLISQDLRRMAESLAEDRPEETVHSIQHFLLDNFAYTLETTAQDDYVEHFLFESNEGYCLHFAMAFLELARLNGIPCRMAEGYLTHLPSQEVLSQGGIPGETIINGHSAHSWPEVYLDGKGWKRVEVTPPFYHLEETENTGSSYPLSSEPGNALAEDPKSNRNLIYSILGLLSILISIGLLLLIRLFFQTRYTPERAVKKLLRWGKKNHWEQPSEKGWQNWLKHIEPLQTEKSHQQLQQIILKFRYSQSHLSQDEMNILIETPRNLKKELKRQKKSKN